MTNQRITGKARNKKTGEVVELQQLYDAYILSLGSINLDDFEKIEEPTA